MKKLLFPALFLAIFLILFYAENSYAVCPEPAASLLGSGCHDMGNAYFNEAMTQYVNYGGSTVYYCSTNYISGCSSGGSTSTSCPSNIASLLGSGCHDMGNAYFNVDMTQYVNYGGSTVYSCSTNYISGCTTGGGGGGGVPAAPSNLRLDPTPTATSVYLKWTDNSSTEDKFNIEREVAGSANWTLLLQTGANIITYTDSSVTSGTTYNYRVQACLSGYGCSEYIYLMGVSPPAPADTQPPSIPTGVGASASSSAVYIWWSASTDNIGVTSYKVFRNSSLLTSVSGSTFSYQDTSVSPATSYQYYVTAVDSAGNESSPSATAYATTPSSLSSTNNPPTNVGIPYGPTSASVGTTYQYGTSATDPDGDQIKFIFDWGDVQTTESAFMPSGSGYQGSHAWISAGTYYVRVKAVDSKGAESAWTSSFAVTVAVGSTSNIPTAPTNLSATAISASQVNLYWTDNSTNEDGFKIYRKLSTDPLWPASYLASVGLGTVNYSDTSVAGYTSYTYKVLAYNSAGVSADSNWAMITTPQGATSTSTSTYPSTPMGLQATAVSSSRIDLSWQPSTDDVGVTEYKIHRNSAYLASVTETSYSDTAVSAGTTYSYNVSAYDAQGNYSPFSSTAYATTLTSANTATTTADHKIYGYVKNSSGQAVSNAEVWYCNNPNSGCSAVKLGNSDANGYWQLSSPASGSYRFWVSGIYFSQALDQSYGGSGSVFAGDLIITDKKIYGYTKNSNGAAVGGASVYYKYSSSAAPSNCTTSSSFFFTSDSAGYWYYNTPQTGYYCFYAVSNGVYSSIMPVYYSSGAVNAGDSVFSVTATTTVDTAAPYVMQFGHMVESDGRLRAGASFSESMRDLTINDLNIYIISVPTGAKISGVLNKYQSGVDYVTSYPAETGVNYQLVVRKNVEDLAGNRMASDYYSTFFQRSAGTVTATSTVTPFTVDALGTFPKSGEAGVDVGIKIRVKFNRTFDQSSTNQQFFSLESANAPGVSMGGTYYMFYDGFEFAPSSALSLGASYTYKVFTTLKDINGAALSAPFSATFTTASGVTGGSAIVAGTVRDGAKNPVANAMVHIFAEDYSRSFSIATDSSGAFRFSIPGGSYVAEIFPPSGRNDLLKPLPVKFSVSSGETKVIDLQFISGAKIISGTVLFPDTKPVTDAEVGAYSSETNQWSSVFTDANGKYTLTVGGGVWKVGVRPRNPSTAAWSWSESLPEVAFSKEAIAEAKTVNFIVMFANSTLVVFTVDNFGNPIPNAGVVIDTMSSTEVLSPNAIRIPSEYRKSDSSGKVTILLAPRTYYVRGSLSSDLGYFNPPEQAVLLPSSEKREIRLVFRKAEIVSFATLSGSVVFAEGGAAADAFVSAWSEKGGFFETRSDSSGKFNMRLSSGERWRMSAGKDYSGYPHKSSELILDVGDNSLSIELVLVKIVDRPLPSSVSVTQSATTQIVAQVEDGAKMVVQPRSAASSGNVSVEIAPTSEAPRQAAAQVVSTVYDVTIRDAAGSAITKLSQDAEIVLPYDEATLKAQGVGEDAIIPSFFDDTAKVWVSISNFTVDKEKNIIIARVSHLTRFAIIAAADITPPPAPSVVSVKANGAGMIEISWKNPTKDFSHAKLYRSEKQAVIGKTIAPEIAGERYTDENVTDKILYYYTVRAVDPAGNESNNMEQASALALGTSQKKSASLPTPAPSAIPAGQAKKLEILRNLTSGSSGDDVKSLQKLLLQEGVYPAGLITGFFGELTKQAVMRFQEKYADEILSPVGLIQGSGYVGPSTRKKMNELMGGGLSVPHEKSIPAGQQIKLSILRDLTVGTSGDDVKYLQEMLLQEGVYPAGLITGFFGELTKQAVMRFQEKYADEILVPVGLMQGSGYAGAMTRKKLNELSAK